MFTITTEKYTRNVLDSPNYISDKSDRLVAPERKKRIEIP